MLSNFSNNISLYLCRLGYRLIDSCAKLIIEIFHWYFDGQFSSLSSLLIYNCKCSRNVSFYNYFSQWYPYTANIISHSAHCHVYRFINQVYCQNLSLHILQKLWWSFNLKLLYAIEKRICTLSCCWSYFKCIKVIAKER